MNRLYYIMLASLVAIASSCSQEPDYIKVDGNAVLALVADGDISEQIVLLEPKVGKCDIRIKAEKKSDRNLFVEIGVDDALVEKYNELNNTSYKMPPTGAYEIQNGKIMLPRYNTISSTSSVSLNSAGLLDTDDYLLPIVIGNIEGDQGVLKSETDSVLYVKFRKRQLPPALNLSKTGFEMLYCNSFSVANYNTKHGFVRSDGSTGDDRFLTGYASDIIDGDYASIWGYNYGNSDLPPYYFVIDFGREITVRGLSLWAQRGNNDMMNEENTTPTSQCGSCSVEFALELSDPTSDQPGMADLNGGTENWFYSESFGATDLKNQICNTVYLSEIVRARYMRFAYRGRYSSATATSVSTGKGGNLAEIDILGNEEVLDLD